MRPRFALSALFAAGFAMFGQTHDVSACGACIPPPGENTVVTGHRMALSLSPKQTVLWDQIEYSGAPESFAWVLPVKPGAVVQVSSDAWFDTLDAATNTQIFQPSINCDNGGGSGFGCGMSDESLAGRAFDDGPNAAGGPSVNVVSRGTVGPYSTVTLNTQTPGALNTWLTDNGFAIDPATQPVVDAYVAEGFDFIALKLLPNKDVSAMRPVRVVQEGANPTLPLRMVAIGSGANVAMTLFLISEGRLGAKDFANAVVPTDLIAWDFKSSSSNYSDLRQSLLAGNGGATWLTTFAFQGSLLGQLQGLPGFMSGTRVYSSPSGGILSDTIATAYVRQGLDAGQQAGDECIPALGGISASSQVVSNPCPLGKPFDDPSCGSVASGSIDARTLVCGLGLPEPLDDVAVAMNGLHPNDVWITRIEANLPREALQKDLTVEAAGQTSTVDNLRIAGLAKNVEVVCGDSNATIVPPGVLPPVKGPGGRENLVVLMGLGLVALAAMARRRFVTV